MKQGDAVAEAAARLEQAQTVLDQITGRHREAVTISGLLAGQRDGIALEAHTDGGAASKRLEGLNREIAVNASNLSSLEAAERQARAMLASARAQHRDAIAALDVDRGRAAFAELLAIDAEFDNALAAAVAALGRRREAIDKLARTGTVESSSLNRLISPNRLHRALVASGIGRFVDIGGTAGRINAAPLAVMDRGALIIRRAEAA